MEKINTTILKFGNQGEKTGWTYIEISADIAQKIKPKNKKSFRVKGKLDNYFIKQVALLPMGNGNFIMPLNLQMRKKIGKRNGDNLSVQIEEDKNEFIFNKDLLACLNDEPDGMKFFQTLPPSHQKYFSKWIDSAKTEPTKTKRLAQTINALSQKMGFGEMLRSLKTNR